MAAQEFDSGDPMGDVEDGQPPISEYDLNEIHVELEKLNISTEVINQLELQLTDARRLFREIQTTWAGKLERLVQKLGPAIDKARPYYEARLAARAALQVSQAAALNYERATSLHRIAKEQVALTQESLAKQDAKSVEVACLEVLSHHITRVNEAEAERARAEKEHRLALAQYERTLAAVRRLERSLSRSLARSRPYFDARVEFTKRLEEQNAAIRRLEGDATRKKKEYAVGLRRLESISEDIHAKRRLPAVADALGERGRGVGCECPDPPPNEEGGPGAASSEDLSNEKIAADPDQPSQTDRATDEENKQQHIQPRHVALDSTGDDAASSCVSSPRSNHPTSPEPLSPTSAIGFSGDPTKYGCSAGVLLLANELHRYDLSRYELASTASKPRRPSNKEHYRTALGKANQQEPAKRVDNKQSKMQGGPTSASKDGVKHECDRTSTSSESCGLNLPDVPTSSDPTASGPSKRVQPRILTENELHPPQPVPSTTNTVQASPVKSPANGKHSPGATRKDLNLTTPPPPSSSGAIVSSSPDSSPTTATVPPALETAPEHGISVGASSTPSLSPMSDSNNVSTTGEAICRGNVAGIEAQKQPVPGPSTSTANSCSESLDTANASATVAATCPKSPTTATEPMDVEVCGDVASASDDVIADCLAAPFPRLASVSALSALAVDPEAPAKVVERLKATLGVDVLRLSPQRSSVESGDALIDEK